MKHTSNGVYKWSESDINKYINGEWLEKTSINTSSLMDNVICDDPSSLMENSYGGTLYGNGVCTTGAYSNNKVRLFTYDEYQNIISLALSDISWLYESDFWLQNSVNSEILHNEYGVQTNTDVNNLSQYVTSISENNTSIEKDSANTAKEVRPVITISSKNIID